MTYSINWPITMRSAVPFRSGNYISRLITRTAVSLRADPWPTVTSPPSGVSDNLPSHMSSLTSICVVATRCWPPRRTLRALWVPPSIVSILASGPGSVSSASGALPLSAGARIDYFHTARWQTDKVCHIHLSSVTLRARRSTISLESNNALPIKISHFICGKMPTSRGISFGEPKLGDVMCIIYSLFRN